MSARKYEVKFRPTLRDKLTERRSFEELNADALKEQERIQHLRQRELKHQKNARIKAAESKAKYVEYLGGKCKRCQHTFPHVAYDFHHRDPSMKDIEISKIMKHAWHLVQRELDKCDLLCACCHRIVHFEEQT